MNAEGPTASKMLRRLIALLFWLLVWQGLSMWVGSPILLVSPLQTVRCLFLLAGTADFWRTIGNTTLRIMLGFVISAVLGLLLGAAAYRRRLVEVLLTPLLSAVKAVPVASVTILILLWVSSRDLSVVISVLIGLPIVYHSTLEGLRSTDEKLLEMADCFQVPALRRCKEIYLPHLAPFLKSTLGVSVGLCWKSGVAAEVIGIPSGTIGDKLYRAKIYLETPELFAWTAAVVLLSMLFEKILRLMLHRLPMEKKND